jgi:S-adenosylmethionine decarboxylase
MGDKRLSKNMKKTKGKFVSKKYLGIHLVAEFWGCRVIEDSKKIKKILIEAAKKAKNTPLKVTIHKFQPQGITGVVLLAESHIAIHSWPQFNYLAIDIFTCGSKTVPKEALKYLKKVFRPKKAEIKVMKRGKL